MSIFEATAVIMKSAFIGLMISVLGGSRFLFPLFTDVRAIFRNCIGYLTGYNVPSTVACMSSCVIMAMVFHGNIFALLTIAASCALLRLIAWSEHATPLIGGDQGA